MNVCVSEKEEKKNSVYSCVCMYVCVYGACVWAGVKEGENS